MHVPHVLSLADDEVNEDDEMDEERVSAVLKPGFCSPILATPAETWEQVWVTGRAALVRLRFNGGTLIRPTVYVRK